MTENNAAQPALTPEEILDAIKAGVRAARDEGLACAGPDNYVLAGALALLSKLRAEGVQAGDERAALSGLLDYVDRNTCTHESTHRGGAIWTICDGCGQKWADDEGGFVPHQDAPAVAAARAALTSAPVSVPNGYQLVPTEPTHAMLQALSGEWHSSRHEQARANYSAMLKTVSVASAPVASENAAHMAGLETSINILSALVDQQRLLLVEVEDVCGRDGHGAQLEDGESDLIDRVRQHLAVTSPAAQPAALASAPVAGEAQPVAYQVRHPHSPEWWGCDQAAFDVVRATRPKDARALYAAPQASEAVRAGYAGVTAWIGNRRATQVVAKDMLMRSNANELHHCFDAARAALSAQPGGQKYWLCCGSTDPEHRTRCGPDCFNTSRSVWGTAEQHSATQKHGGRNA